MKLFKRAFVGVIVLAVLASCVAFAVTATDNEFTIDNYAAVLEYYEEPVIFDYDFEDMTVGSAFEGGELQLGMKNNQTAVIQGDDSEKYLCLTNSAVKSRIRAMYINGNLQDENGVDDFLFTATVSGNTMVKLYVNSEEKDLPSADNSFALFSMYFGNATDDEGNVVKYYNGGSLAVLKDTDNNDFALTPNEKYEVKLAYASSNGVYSLEVIKLSDNTSAKVDNIPVPVTAVMNIRFGADEFSAKTGITEDRDNVIKTNIHSISAYGGTLFRNVSEKQAQTEVALLNMSELFADENITLDDKIGIATVVGKLVSAYGFVSDKSDVNAAIDSIVEGSIVLYANQLEVCLRGATDDLTYAERVKNIEDYQVFRDLIPENFAEIIGEDKQEEIDRITGIIDRFNSEVQLVKDYKTHSDAFINVIAKADSSSDDYAALSSWFDEAKEHYEQIYKNYEGISDSIRIYGEIQKKIDFFRGPVADFIESALKAADTTQSFGNRYEAYIIAKEKQASVQDFPGVNTYKNDQGKSYDEAAADLAGIYSYVMVTSINGVEVDYRGVEALIALCDSYIANVKSADTALYVKAQIAFIAAADENVNALSSFIDDYDGYPGMTDAIGLREQINTDINNKKAAAVEYVSAIEALKITQSGENPLKGDALAEELEKIKVKQEAGNVLGFDDVDVASANIYFSEIKLAYDLEKGYKDQYVARVKAIDFETMTTSELYEAISFAKNAENSKYVTDDYEDVREAKVVLQAATTRYNDMISGTNTAFAEANSVGADISSLPANDSGKDAAQFIKDLFE